MDRDRADPRHDSDRDSNPEPRAALLSLLNVVVD